MTSRAVIYLGLTVALAACHKNAQTEGLTPPPRDSVRMATPTNRKPGDTTGVQMARPDTSVKARTDTTGQR